MSECNKVGIRVYPVPRGKYYYLIVAFHKKTFMHGDLIYDFSTGASKIIEGKKMYHSSGKEWVEKIHELYKHFYENKIKPKNENDELRKVS